MRTSIFAAAIVLAGSTGAQAQQPIMAPSAILAEQCKVAAKEFDMRGKDEWELFGGGVRIGTCIGEMHVMWFPSKLKHPCIPAPPQKNSAEVAALFVDFIKANPSYENVVEDEAIEAALVWKYCQGKE